MVELLESGLGGGRDTKRKRHSEKECERERERESYRKRGGIETGESYIDRRT